VEYRKQCDDFLDKIPNGKIYAFGHSEAATVLRNGQIGYNPDRRKQIDNTLIAPSAYIDRQYSGKVKHYESERDFIPHLDGYGRNLCRDTIITLTPHKDAPFFDHPFMSPTYEETLQKKMKDITNNPVMDGLEKK